MQKDTELINVYKYRVYDINSDSRLVAPGYATEKFINGISGSEVLYETLREVCLAELDGNGKVNE